MSAPAGVLLVEDDADIREVLMTLFSIRGIPAREARDGVEALERLREGPPPALILLDLMMPRLDGEGLIGALRGVPGLATVPIVVMSGHGDGRARAAELGAAGYLAKPVEVADVLALVARYAAG